MIDVTMPEIGEGVTEATIVEWHVAAGQDVSIGDLLVEVMTDKVNLEVEAQAAGTITEILAKADDEVRVGATIARMKPADGEAQ